MRSFTVRELKEALAYAAAGGQAVHLHRVLSKNPPPCFERAVRRGENIAHLFDLDVERLIVTGRRLGVSRIRVHRRETPSQHIDLCGGPLARALELCVSEEYPPGFLFPATPEEKSDV